MGSKFNRQATREYHYPYNFIKWIAEARRTLEIPPYFDDGLELRIFTGSEIFNNREMELTMDYLVGTLLTQSEREYVNLRYFNRFSREEIMRRMCANVNRLSVIRNSILRKFSKPDIWWIVCHRLDGLREAYFSNQKTTDIPPAEVLNSKLSPDIFGTRLYNALKRKRCTTVADIYRMGISKIASIPYIGPKTVEGLQATMQTYYGVCNVPYYGVDIE